MANILQQSQLEETSTWIDRPALYKHCVPILMLQLYQNKSHPLNTNAENMKHRCHKCYTKQIISHPTVVIRQLCCTLFICRRKFQDESWSAKDVKLCATVAILACLFTACTLPLTTVLLCYDYLGVGRRTKRGICVLLALLNSVVNPVIYILRVKEFRNIMKPSACCTKQNHVSPYSAELENPEYLQLQHCVFNLMSKNLKLKTQ
jgi:hypothetical protein